MKRLKEMKVLSPAGSLESFYVALNNGADEIYMGINSFNARAKAQNIEYEDLRNAIIDAHILGVQVFCTLNTLIFEDELLQVTETIKNAINLGFDAFIVQDLAVIKIIKSIKPNAVIHLSTQLGIHNSFGAVMAEKLGASRIVLSREASLDDIRAIKKAVPNMEIEYFVQGALCVAFSGNCYLSNRLLCKSGNRGECAQICRLPYSAKFGNEMKEKAYYLSPADLCLYQHLQELKDAGVTSLKIEGRLRRASYVGVATAFYRKAVDGLQVSSLDIDNLKTTFNRGNYLSNAYLYSNDFDNIIYKEIQNHIGIKIGNVVDCEKFKDIYKIKLKLNKQIGKNDGLKLLRNGKEVASLGVGNIEVQGKYTIIYSKQKVRQNDEIRLIHSESLEQNVLSKRKTCKLNFEVEFKENCFALISATLENSGLKFSVQSGELLQSAVNCAISKEDIVASLSKLNDTIFSANEIKVESDNVFIAKSQLNRLRRELLYLIRDYFACEKIEVDSCQVLKQIDSELQGFNCEKSEKVSLNLKREIGANDKNVAYFPYEFLQSGTFLQIEKYINKTNGKFHLFLPPFIIDKDLKLIYQKLLPYKDSIIILANNLSQLYFVNDFEVVACDFCNITNHISASIYKSLGAKAVSLGYEISDRKTKPFSYEYEIQNNSIVCFLSHCPYKVVSGTTCKDCQFNDCLSYSTDNGVVYKVERYKITRCYFYLCLK
ncbi:MAG: U32 family peptidase [Christensenellales bacterium]